jgi:hypothetical protein
LDSQEEFLIKENKKHVKVKNAYAQEVEKNENLAMELSTCHVWGTDIPWVHWKGKRPHERPKGPINRKVIPSWAWEGTISKAG